MNLYKTSKGQLIVILVAGLLFWIFNTINVFDSYRPSGFSQILVILIPGILIFYSLGWRNANKNLIEINKDKKIKSLKKDIDNSIEIKYFSVSTTKLIFMSIATFGLYDLYWFYKNWKAVLNAEKISGSPFWRAWFSIFYCYSLFKRILLSSLKKSYREYYSPGILATVYIIFLIFGFLAGKGDSVNYYVPYLILFLLSSLTFLPILRVQKAINFNNLKIDKNYKPSEKFSVLESLIGVVGLILFILTLLPSNLI